ncbi:hypothetical protein ABID42_004752 [Arcicella rosea]|uniref:DUF3103 family protein n=1 Tax=Arcicella rosea TaxID=502909 RepID=UPI00345DFD61
MKNFSTNKFSSILLSVSIACLLYSCDKNDSFAPEEKSIEPVLIEQVDYDPKLEAVAKALAASMGEESVRTLIKTEALKKFDGDYDVLYQNIGEKAVSGKSFSSIIAQNAQKVNIASRTMPFNELTSQIPLLNISVPVNIAKWNTSSFEPLVVVTPKIKDETKLTRVKAFDKAGNIHWLDAKKAPNYPVVVVGQNERLEISNTGEFKAKKGLLYNFDSAISLNSTDESLDDGTGGNGGGGGSGGGQCSGSMPYSTGVYLLGYNSGNISAIESWFNGDPEIRMTCAYTNQSNNSVNIFGQTTGNLHNPDRSWVDAKWWNLNDYLFYWQSSIGDAVSFVLWEEDAGTLINFPVTVKGKFLGVEFNSSFTVNISDDNEWIGSFPVYREDFCSGKTFGNNSLYFKLGY